MVGGIRMRTFALTAHVAARICTMHIRRFGLQRGWLVLRWLWLSGALDGRLPWRYEVRGTIHPLAPICRVGEEVWN